MEERGLHHLSTAADVPATLEGVPDVVFPATRLRTYLLADVRGYTRYTERHGDEAAAALAASVEQVVEAAAGRYGADLIGVRGDEVALEFASARAALRAAVEIQVAAVSRGLAAEIGIGLDAGEAVVLDRNMAGGALNVASRLCSAAAPREVLASETLVTLAGHVDGLVYGRRRALRLKGLSQPVRAVTVEPEGGLPAAPAVLAEGAPPRRLRRRPLAAAAIAAVAVAVAAAYALVSRSPTQIAPESVSLLDASGSVERSIPGKASTWLLAADGQSLVSADTRTTDVAQIDPDGHQTMVDVGAAPADVVARGDSAWVALPSKRAVRSVDFKFAAAGRQVTVGNGPQSLALDGKTLWVVNGIDGTVAEVDTTRGKVAGRWVVGGHPGAVAVAGGSVWVTEPGQDEVVELDPRSHRPAAAVHVAPYPTALAALGKKLWVVDAVGRVAQEIDVATASVVTTVPLDGQPTGVAVYHGTVWVAQRHPDQLVRIDAAAGEREDGIQLSGGSAHDIVAGPSGVWFATATTDWAHYGGTLHAVTSARPATPDPASAVTPDDLQVDSLVYDGLMGYQRLSGGPGLALAPDLATAAPRVLAGGRAYQFDLRTGVRYANGQRLRASDFRRGLERLFRVGSPDAVLFTALRGGRSCLRAPSACRLTGVVPHDAAGTVVFRLAQRDPDLLAKLGLPAAAPVPPGRWADTAAVAPPGTGPYAVAHGSFGGDHGVLVRDPRFRLASPYAQPAGYPDTIDLRLGQPASKDAAAVAAGTEDVTIGGLPAGALRATALHADSGLLAATVVAVPDSRRGPFASAAVRHAVAMALDRAGLALTFGRGLATCQVLPPLLPGYRPDCADSIAGGTAWSGADPTTAAALVAGAGAADAPVSVAAGAGLGAVAAAVAATLDDIGLRAHVGPLAQADLRVVVDRPAVATPGGILLGLLRCPSALAVDPQLAAPATVRCSPALDRLAGRALRAASAADPTSAAFRWGDLDRALVGRHLVIPLFTPAQTVFRAGRVGDFRPHPLFGTVLDALWTQ